MTLPDDESERELDTSSPVEPSPKRIDRAKAKAGELKDTGAEILEREQANRTSVRIAVDAFYRDRRFAGGLLAGGSRSGSFSGCSPWPWC